MQVPAQDRDGCIGDEEEHQWRNQFTEPVQQRNHQKDRAAGQVQHGDPQHVLAHDQALDAEEEADGSADPGCDGQNPEVTRNGFAIVPRPRGDTAFERHVRHADGSALDRHELSVTRQGCADLGFS